MKTLITTTAIALIMAMPVTAQTTGGDQGQTTLVPGTAEDRGAAAGQAEGWQAGYYDSMQQGDLRASELMNATIFAPETGNASGMDATGGSAERGTGAEADGSAVDGMGSRWGRTMTMQDLEQMEQIGEVEDLILDEEGRVQAVLVDVGAFLGMGGRNVALGLHQLNFVTDTTDPSRIYVVSMIGADTLEEAPEFDETVRRDMGGSGEGMTDATGSTGMDEQGWRGDRERLTAPVVEREGFERVEANRMSVDNLLGASVYDARDEDVGDISDVVLGQDGAAQYVIVDVGGFLGIGTHTVAIGFDEMTVMQGRNLEDLRVYVDVTEESLEAMPEHTRD
jgi:sporulation protein YlmC with PRC-barrel domain